MRVFSYKFSTRIEYDKSVSHQDFLLRAIPFSAHFQKLNDYNLTVMSEKNYCIQKDSFGNSIQFGRIQEDKDFFEFNSTGSITQTKYLIFDSYNPIYLYETSLSKASEEMIALYNSIKLKDSDTILSKTQKICDAICNVMTYKKNITDFTTKASHAFEIKSGVCQDFAQIATSLCRLAKIPTRYISGLMLGEGESHAWIEVWDNYRWYGFDPTNNNKIEYNYIKISHGRDSRDCALNKGINSCISEQKVQSIAQVFQKYD